MLVNIKDVAKKAGVSTNTVSRYLNNRGYISEKTRMTIQQVIDELNYIPNQVARNLFKNKTNLIGLVIPDVKHPFFSTMTSYIENELDKRNLKMILCNTANSSEKEKGYIQMLQENKVDGIIIGSHSIDIDYSNINAPIVSLDRYLAPSIPVVTADHNKGGTLAAQYLIDAGCQNVLQISGYSHVDTPSNHRYRAFEQVMEKQGIPCTTYELKWNQFDFDSYLQVAKELQVRYPEVDGVFAVDLVAAAFLREALKKGTMIPQDLQIVGYDGSFVSRMMYPTFPSVVQPCEELAQEAVTILEKLMNKESLDKLTYELDVYLSDWEG